MFLKKQLSIFLLVLLVFSSFTTGTALAVVDNSSPVTKEDLLKQLNITAEEQDAVVNQIQQDTNMKPSKDTLIIKYSQPIPARVHSQAGVVLKKRVNALNYDVVKITGNKKMEEVISYYRGVDHVQSVTPSVPVQTLATSFNDPKASDMYHLEMVNASKALSLAGDNEVIVAVVDTGMDVNHPELKNQVLKAYNILDPMKNPLPDVHGTHVAGIIASEANNGIGGYGINPNAKILPIDVFNRGMGMTTDYSVAEGILYAVDQGANVINLSLGTFYPSKILEDAVTKAIDAGVTVVASAGNEAGSFSRYPAAFEGVISVGAINEDYELASFSNFGPSVDIVGPGEQVYAPYFDIDKHSTFMELSGTSMSAPVVSGVVSLLLSQYPDLTPKEVRYILQQTAKDLGDPGYDLKFGFGLVDPVAALQFDLKNLPNFSIESDDLVESATELFISRNEGLIDGEISLPSQVNWYSMPVSEGELIQATLSGAQLFDYKMTLIHFGENWEIVEEVEVNDVAEGELEAYLFEAKEDGTLLIGIQDAFGQYSKEGKSRYTLHLQIEDEWLDDGISAQNPFQIQSFPYSSFWQKDGPFYLTAKPAELEEETLSEEEIEAASSEVAEEVAEKAPVEEQPKSSGADYDFFTFSVDEPKVVEINVIGVPGVNLMLSLYHGDEFRMVPPEMLGKSYYDEGFMGPWPMERANQNGVGKGETLVFDAMPGMEYVLEVTNAADYYYYDPYMFFFYGFDDEMDFQYPSSHIPYHIRIKAEQLPPDEDGFPMNMYYDPYMYEEEVFEEQPEEAPLVNYRKTYAEVEQDFIIYYGHYYYEKEMVQKVLDIAPDYEIGSEATGYFQTSGDIDIFKVEPNQSGIYEFSFNDTDTLRPNVTVLKYDEEEEMLFPIAYSDSYYYFYGPPEIKNELYVGLEKDKTYIVMMQNSSYRPSLDAYTLNSQLLVENPQDEYAPNHTVEEAVALPDGKVIGNFAMGNEVDYFYFEAESDQVFGLNLEVLQVNEKDRNGLPEELFTPIMPAVLVIEDIDGDGELSNEEMNNAMFFFDFYGGAEVNGSFNVKAGKTYFVAVMNYYYYGSGTSLTPYQLLISPASKGGDITPLKEVSKNKLATKGYFETNHHEKMYQLDLNESRNATVELAIPRDIDGVLSIYDANKKLIKTVDYYGKGDAEILQLSLEKGNYYIGVKDYYKNGSISPYELTVTLN